MDASLPTKGYKNLKIASMLGFLQTQMSHTSTILQIHEKSMTQLDKMMMSIQYLITSFGVRSHKEAKKAQDATDLAALANTTVTSQYLQYDITSPSSTPDSPASD